MTDDQFDVLDELYFIQSFVELTTLTGKSEEDLVNILIQLYENEWIKVFKSIEEELTAPEIDFISSAKFYFFLASKKGLLAHNTTN